MMRVLAAFLLLLALTCRADAEDMPTLLSLKAEFTSAFEAGNIPLAKSLATEIVSITEKIDLKSTGYAVALFNLATVNRIQQDHAAASSLFSQSMHVQQGNEENPEALISNVFHVTDYLIQEARELVLAEQLLSRQIDKMIKEDILAQRNREEIYRRLAYIYIATERQNLLGDLSKTVARERAQHADFEKELNRLERSFNLRLESGENLVALGDALELSALARKMFGRSSPQYIRSIFNIGSVYNRMSQDEKSERYFADVLALAERYLEFVSQADFLYQVAKWQHGRGQYGEAERLFRSELEIRRKISTASNADIARALSDLGQTLANQGNLSDSEKMQAESLSIYQELLPETHQIIARLHNNIGQNQRFQGNYKAAITSLTKSMEIFYTLLGPAHEDTLTSVRNLAHLLFSTGDYKQSLELYSRAVEVGVAALGPSHADNAIAWTGKADCHVALGRSAEGINDYNRAIEIYDTKYGLGNVNSAYLQLTVAKVISIRNGLAKNSKELAQRVITHSRNTFGPRHPNVADGLQDLGDILLLSQDPAGALAVYQESKQIGTRIFDRSNPRLIEIKLRLGKAYLQTGKFKEAKIAAAEISQSIFDLLRLNANREDFDYLKGKDVIAEAVETYFDIEWKTSTASERESGPIVSATLDIAERAIRGVSSKAIAQSVARLVTGSDSGSALVRKWQDLANERRALSQHLLDEWAKKEPSKKRIDYLSRTIRERNAVVDEAYTRISESAPSVARLIGQNGTSIPQLQKLLKDDEIVVKLFVGKSASFIWVLGRREFKWIRVPLDNELAKKSVQTLRCGLDLGGAWNKADNNPDCEKLVGRSRHELRDGEPLPFRFDIAYSLYISIFGQIEDSIRGKYLIFIPSGALASLPPHVLLTHKPNPTTSILESYRTAQWLGIRQSISIAPSVSSLLMLRGVGSALRRADSYLGVGDPILTGNKRCPVASSALACSAAAADSVTLRLTALRGPVSDDGGYATMGEAIPARLKMLCPLPDTKFELRCIANNFGAGNFKLMLQSEATEKFIKSVYLRNYRFVHFATHGLMANESASVAKGLAEPGLVLTPPDKSSQDDDGLLTVSEIARLDLDAELVILSACNTASGSQLDGDALGGLAQAFFYAGARSVLASHWYIDSYAAAQLTSNLFATMGESPQIRPAEALRRAIVDFRNMEDEWSVHPAFWAPFVVVN